jgi:hypothetical protein
VDLKDIRGKFAQLSGRWDLVSSLTTPWTDNGANFLINEGSKFLDRMYGTPKEWGRVFETCAAGVWYVTFSRCRAIKKVWVASSSEEERWELEEKDLDYMRSQYTDLISEVTRNDPEFYATAMLRGIDTTDKDADGEFFDYVLADSDEISGVLIYPPPDTSITVEVWGKFYSDELTVDADENYWTKVHPGTLIKAAMYEAEVFNRNSQGQRDLLAGIEADVIGIDKDVVEEQIANTTKMRG